MHHIQNIYQGCRRWIDLQEVIEPIGFIALGILQVWKHFFSISSFSFGIVTLLACGIFLHNSFAEKYPLNPLLRTVFHIIFCGIFVYLFNLFVYGFNWFRGKTSCSPVFALRLIACQGAIIAFSNLFAMHLQGKEM